MGLGLALVTGQVLVFMPNKVAGQGQGELPPQSVVDTVVVDAGVIDTGLENTGLVPNRPTVRPTRTDTPPEIDGRLDD